MVDTTTDDPILPDDAGAEEPAVPAEDKTESKSAANPTDQTETKTEGDEDKSVPEVDEKLVSFAKGQGIDDLEGLTKRELSLLKSAYDNKAEYERNRQKATELEKTLTTQLDADIATADPDTVNRLAAEIQSLKLAQSVSSFFQSNPDAKAYEAKMTELVTQDPDLGQLVKSGYMGVDRLYHIAKGSDPTVTETAKQQGGKEALQQLANKQQAKAVVGNATTSEFSDNSKPDPFLDAFNQN